MKHPAKKSRTAPRRPAAGPAAVPAPVPGGEFSRLIHRILVPIDFSEHSRNALKYAVPMAEQTGAELFLVYVVEPTIYPADLGFGQVVLPGVEEELRQKSAEELESLIATEIAGRVPASCAVRTGKPYQEILRAAKERKIDLIIMATHGHTGVEHILFGSTAERIVRHATCPVLTIRPEESMKVRK
jgi:nucleotide-binding universal stress UspA family protein